ncbi:TadE/TadG family type IV pilus assembly protein [Spongisporangium articulatum]|uniref:TadE/TadG family type IV pilus assembly protein n=1 Tax=Spongisporangium articulatum TaxID=3362603 RepID=A0ABW8AI96_9ACTN
MRTRFRRVARPAPRSRDRGAAAVEMALVTPLLLLVVCGFIDLGMMLNTQIALSAAAREGVRSAALGGTDVTSRVAAATTSLRSAPTTSVISCPANATGTNATVTVTSVYVPITPIGRVARLLGGSFPGTVTLTGRGVMRCGG